MASLSVRLQSPLNAITRTASLQPSTTQTRASLPRRNFILTRAQADGESTQAVTSADAEAAPKKKTVIRRVKKPDADVAADVDLQTKLMDDPSLSYEGVVRLDKGAGFSLGQLATLAAGDLLSLVVFAYIGRATHVSAAIDFELLKTAMPFITGWLISSTLWGEYSPSRQLPRSVPAVAGSTAKPWAVGVPVGIAIRSVIKGQAPQVPFMIVSMVTTFVIVSVWRYTFFNVIAKDVESSGEGSDRSGTAFEFFELLTSLVRRW